MAQESTPSLNPKKSLPVWIGILVGVALIGGAAALAVWKANQGTETTPTPNTNTATNGASNTNASQRNTNNEPSSGNTYTSPVYAYRFSYPEGSTIDEQSPEEVFVRPAGESFGPLPTVKVVRMTTDEYVESLLAEDSLNKKVADQPLEVNGRVARRVVIFTAVGLNYEHVIFEREGYVIDIVGLENDPALLTVRDSMILLDSPIDTSDWKTYTNTRRGYSIQYPASWRASGEPASDSFAFFAPTQYLSLQVGPGVMYLDGETISNKLRRYGEDFGKESDFRIFEHRGIQGAIFTTKTLGSDWVPTALIARPTFSLTLSLEQVPLDEREYYRRVFETIINTIQFSD